MKCINLAPGNESGVWQSSLPDGPPWMKASVEIYQRPWSAAEFRIQQASLAPVYNDLVTENKRDFFFLHFWPPWQPTDLLGQGSDLNCSCDLRQSCSNAGSLTHCAGPGIKPASQHSQDAADPAAPQQELPKRFFFFFCLFAISLAALAAYGGSQARGLIGAVATGLHQSHSNARSEPSLQPTPQLMATPGP